MGDLLESIDARGVVTITLNRPERHNAFDDALVAQLTEALRRLDADPNVRVVALSGAGRTFCAGGDIEWMRRLGDRSFDENLSDAVALAELMHTLDRLSKPTIALVRGAAYGGGVGLVACCDVVIASERANFCLSEVRLGVIPAAIGPYILRSIGARQARRFVLTAEVISAERAREIGLVHEVVKEIDLPVAKDRVVEALLSGAPGAQAEAKSSMFLYEGRRIDDNLMKETARRIATLRASPEGREGLSAFLDKRAPAWRANRNQ
jgi:methylglutaconyl-CoA hydratase